jgi:cardiolipin synthase C
MVRGDAATRPGVSVRPRRWISGLRWPPLALLALVVALGGCATLRTDYPRTASSALPPQFDGASGRYVQSEVGGHPGQCGFRLLSTGTDALMSRLWLIDHALHSIDLQYFIFLNDATGRLVAQRLLAAADRGVRVRLLLDDISLVHEDRLLGALDSHPHMEVRVFNPFRTRDPSWVSKIAQVILDGARLNRRMHNKSMVVDGFVAVLGGRNIADAYFGADGGNNFRDLDVLAIGPVVGAAASAFDEYWNSNAAYPVDAYRTTRDAHADLASVRPELTGSVRAFEQSDYAQAMVEKLPHGATGDRPGRWVWGDATLLVDEPQKIETRQDDPALRIGPKVKQAMDGAERELLLVSPYFVPSDRGVRYLTALVRRGVAVRVLTNSLASTDDPAAEAGYAHARRALLEGGVQLYELQPSGDPRPQHSDASASAGVSSSGVSLHAKAIVIDRRVVFVGSMNLDPRSKLLNTEMGVLADSPQLAAEVARFFEQAADPHNAFRVQLERNGAPSASGGHLSWSWDDHGTPVSSEHEPDVSAARHLEFALARLLPIEGLL